MDTIIFYGADWCSDCKRAKKYLKENDIEYEYIDVDVNQSATKLVETINKGKRIIPTIIINDHPYTNPDNGELARVLGLNNGTRVVLYGADWCPDCRRAKKYLSSNDVNYQFIDVDVHDWATDKVIEINKGKRIIPTITINNVAYSNPDNGILKDKLGIGEESEKVVYDTLIVGGGAAGLTTSIYAQRDRFSTVILEKKAIGGNASLTKSIENYPGFDFISGPDLMDKMANQAETYGAKIDLGVDVKGIHKKDGLFHTQTNLGEYMSKSVVLAVGSTYRRLEIPNEEELIGAGVHFCATCDGAFYRDREILVIGGGNSALEEGIFLAGFCKKVTFINWSDKFTGSETYIEKLEFIDNITYHHNQESKEFTIKDGVYNSLKTKNRVTGEDNEFFSDGVFIFIGLVPNTEMLKGVVDLDARGFIKTKRMAETSIDGVFAAGDCREGAIAQVAAATGEGVLASYGVKAFLK